MFGKLKPTRHSKYIYIYFRENIDSSEKINFDDMIEKLLQINQDYE
jgi:hypothetical protein